METYTLNLECTNCDYSGEVEIIKGLTYRGVGCPTCGCETLKKKVDVSPKWNTKDPYFINQFNRGSMSCLVHHPDGKCPGYPQP